MLCVNGFPTDYLRYQLNKRGLPPIEVEGAVDYVRKHEGIQIMDEKDYERIAKGGLKLKHKKHNFPTTYPLKLPFKVNNYPRDFDGYFQISRVKLYSAHAAIPDDQINSDRVTTKFLICDNIEHVNHATGIVFTFLDLTKLDEDFVYYILDLWDGDMPISLYLEINGFSHLVKDSWLEVKANAIIDYTGTLFHYPFPKDRVKRRKVTKPSEINTLINNRRPVFNNNESTKDNPPS